MNADRDRQEIRSKSIANSMAGYGQKQDMDIWNVPRGRRGPISHICTSQENRQKAARHASVVPGAHLAAARPPLNSGKKMDGAALGGPRYNQRPSCTSKGGRWPFSPEPYHEVDN